MAEEQGGEGPNLSEAEIEEMGKRVEAIFHALDGCEMSVSAHSLIAALLSISLECADAHRCADHPKGYEHGKHDAEILVSVMMSINKQLQAHWGPHIRAHWEAKKNAMH